MFGVSKFTFWVLTGLVSGTTIFFNVYIFLMTLWNKTAGKERSPSDTIIMALAAADLTHQFVCCTWMTMDEIDSDCRIVPIFYSVLMAILSSFKFIIIWDTTFLTFYYSTKLVSTPNQCYTQIQASILKHVTLAVFLIPLFGFATCIPIFAVFNYENITEEVDPEMTCGFFLPNSTTGLVYDILYLLLSDVLPGLLMLKCCISISIHLVIHLRHMKASTNGAHPPKLSSQMRVVKMSLSLVVNFLIFLIVDLYINYQVVVKHDNSIGVTFFITSVYTTFTAMLLIYGKHTVWKNMVQDINMCLGAYPCFSYIQLPEEKAPPEK